MSMCYTLKDQKGGQRHVSKDNTFFRRLEEQSPP